MRKFLVIALFMISGAASANDPKDRAIIVKCMNQTIVDVAYWKGLAHMCGMEPSAKTLSEEKACFSAVFRYTNTEATNVYNQAMVAGAYRAAKDIRAEGGVDQMCYKLSKALSE